MGTPEFAVASLKALLEGDFNIVGVVTAPDKPAGRGMKMNESAVKKFALEHGLKILQPEKLKNKEFLEELKSLNTDLQIVVAFRMLPEVVWNMPKFGTINLHGSLLPQYRGAAPINWAIINGEKETGVTTFKLQQEIDTGNILLQEKIKIRDDETAGELHDEMKELGAKLLVKTIQNLSENEIKEIKQEEIIPEILHHAPKITTEICKIDWTKSVDQIYNLIRGLSPYPTAFTFLKGKMLKIYKAEKEVSTIDCQASTIKSDGKTFLKFACSNGFIHVLELQMEGKKRMNIPDFLKGFRI